MATTKPHKKDEEVHRMYTTKQLYSANRKTMAAITERLDMMSGAWYKLREGGGAYAPRGLVLAVCEQVGDEIN